MAENSGAGANAPGNWFRAFSRSSNTNLAATKQGHEQCPSPTSPTAPSLSNYRPEPLHYLHHRHTFHHHRTPTSNSPISSTTNPAESPSRSSHQKSASATLRTVSSFLSLKSAKISGSSTSTGSAGPSPSHDLFGTESVSASSRDSTLEWLTETRIRNLAPLSMLPLLELEDGSETDGTSGDHTDYGRGAGSARRTEGTWHNPRLLQTVEMLGSVMATKPIGKPLDTRYDSCVLSLIEGFYRLTKKLREADEKIAELKDLRERELEQFRSMSEEWAETTEAYKAEIKRLELALAKESKDGVARVALARHGSLVDRAGSKRFQARLRRINKSAEESTDSRERDWQSLSSPEPMDLAESTSCYKTLCAIPRILDSTNDVLVSRILEEREYEEAKARRQDHQQGRVRASPVLVRARQAADLDYGSLQPFDYRSRSTLAMTTSTISEDTMCPSGQAQPVDGTHHLACSTPRLVSGLGASNLSRTEPASGFTPIKDVKIKDKLNNRGKPMEVESPKQQAKGKRMLPQLKIKREYRSFQELSNANLELTPSTRRRCYSFEKGEEVLTVTSPLCPTFPNSQDDGCSSTPTHHGGRTPEIQQSPGNAQRFLSGLTGAPGGENSEDESGLLYMRPRSRASQFGGSVTSSASAETVRWAGENKKRWRMTKQHCRTEDGRCNCVKEGD